MNSWQGLPYYPISQFYKKLFGQKVYKLSVNLAKTCPNREGIRGMKVCHFCDVWGSSAYPEYREDSLKEQIEKIRIKMKKRYKADKFLIYFQAYTNTFTSVKNLDDALKQALSFKDICGAVIGTRPDCISQGVLKLINQYQKELFISVELGVQSFDNKTLDWMRRGHTKEQSIEAIRKIRLSCPYVDLGIHLIFGNLNETDSLIKKTAEIINELPINNVKLHNLHVLKNTSLEKDFYEGNFKPITKKDYIDRVILFLEALRPDIAVHRLTAVASRHEELIAPLWARSKMENYQSVLEAFKKKNTYQGASYLS